MVNIAPHLTNTYLNLIILPTEKCNFRCTYCYEDFEIGKMKPELIDSVKKLIDARIQDLDTLEISWFGGEPLLAKEIIYDLMNHAQKIKKVFGKTLKSNMTTNAYLLDSESFKELVDRGVNVFQITLDGPSIDHNKSRILANGGDTFSKVVRNLEYISKTSFDFEVLLRIHYHPRNLKQLESLFRELPSSIVQDVRFKFFFKAIHHLGGENDSEFSVYSEYEEKTLTQNLNELAVKYSFNLCEDQNSQYVCYAAAANSLVIRANGKINKCTVGLNDDINSVGELLEGGILKMNNELFRKWINPLLESNETEMACPYNSLKKESREIAVLNI